MKKRLHISSILLFIFVKTPSFHAVFCSFYIPQNLFFSNRNLKNICIFKKSYYIFINTLGEVQR